PRGAGREPAGRPETSRPDGWTQPPRGRPARGHQEAMGPRRVPMRPLVQPCRSSSPIRPTSTSLDTCVVETEEFGWLWISACGPWARLYGASGSYGPGRDGCVGAPEWLS